MIQPCPGRGASGVECPFDAEDCPIHGADSPEPAPFADSGESVAQLARQALVQVAEGEASPTFVARYVRSLGAIENLPASDTERADMLVESAVIGGMLHGRAPGSARQWEVAKRNLDAETVEQLRRFPPTPNTESDRATCMAEATWPIPGTFGSYSRSIWGDKAFTEDPTQEQLEEFFDKFTIVPSRPEPADRPREFPELTDTWRQLGPDDKFSDPIRSLIDPNYPYDDDLEEIAANFGIDLDSTDEDDLRE